MLKEAHIEGEWVGDDLIANIQVLAFSYWLLRKSIHHNEHEAGVSRGIDNVIELALSGPDALLHVR